MTPLEERDAWLCALDAARINVVRYAKELEDQLAKALAELAIERAKK